MERSLILGVFSCLLFACAIANVLKPVKLTSTVEAAFVESKIGTQPIKLSADVQLDGKNVHLNMDQNTDQDSDIPVFHLLSDSEGREHIEPSTTQMNITLFQDTEHNAVFSLVQKQNENGTVSKQMPMAVASPFTIDEIISNATENVEEVAFVQGQDQERPNIKVELDMIFTPEQWDFIQKNQASSSEGQRRERRKAIRDNVNDLFHWNVKVIPYEYASDVFSSEEISEIQRALDEWTKYTCISFRSAETRDRNKIRFISGEGCSANVGMAGNTQFVELGFGCLYKSIVVHEIGHAVGFQHEHTRPDRDDYVEIIRENIESPLMYEINFRKYSTYNINDYGVPYDYTSIMHYGPTAFSVNQTHPSLTIRTKDPSYQDVIGKADGLSFRDIKLANLMYQCNAHCDRNIQCPGEGFLDKTCQCVCPGDPVQQCSGGTGTETRMETDTGTNKGNDTGTDTKTPECTDYFPSCASWAGRGECTSYRVFMTTYCKLSCKACRAMKEDCNDKSEHCEYWSSQGYCPRKYVIYMRSNCTETCRVCTSGSSNVNLDSRTGK